MSTEQPISPPDLQPIWTPDDYEQTRRDAVRHQWDQRIEQYAAQAALYAAGPVMEPKFVVTPGRSAFGTAAHEALLGRTIDELRSPIYRDPILGMIEAPTSPPCGRQRAPEPVGMRPRRAAQLTKMTLSVAVVVLVLVVGVLWAATIGAGR